MKANLIAGFLLAALGIGAALIAAEGTQLKITSSVFQDGGEIPSKFTCDGTDASPQLHLDGAPPAAKSLALIMDDPDAPGGSFTHWIVWNIDPKTNEIGQGGAPAGAIQGRNDFGKSGYGGPCPPSGTHRYYFRIFTLDRMLDLKSSAKRAELDSAIRGHVLAKAELMGRYSRGR